MFSIAIQNNSSRNLSILLSFWVYTYALFYFIPLIIPSTTMLMYIWLIVIDGFVVLNSKRISAKLIEFLLAYVLIVLVNVAVVSYKYYVVIDAFSGMAVFLPALLIISSSSFDLSDFLSVWRKFAFFITIVSPIAIVLMQKKVIDYGVFTYLNLPNCIVCSYQIMTAPKHDRSKKKSLIVALTNFAIILLFGGRMAAFAAAFSIFLGYMISSSVMIYKKILTILFIGVAGILIVNNINTILQYAEELLNKYNLSSRSFSLLVEQMKTSGTNIHMSGRNIIYEEIVDYIADRGGLPGGFGVSLYVTNGKFYHPHNLFLQLTVMFGVFGGIFFILLTLHRLMRIKRSNLQFEYQFTLLILIEYLVVSFTGGSILNNFIAIIGVGMAFFYRRNR